MKTNQIHHRSYLIFRRNLGIFFFCFCLLASLVHGFQFLKPKRLQPLLNVIPVAEEKVSSSSSRSPDPHQNNNQNNDDDENDDEQQTSKSSTLAPLLDWNASGSIGSLLMQMQKKEEELKKLNKTLLDKDQALDLSLNATKTSSSTSTTKTTDDTTSSDTEVEMDEDRQVQKVKDDLFSWMLPKQEDDDEIDEDDDEGFSSGTMDVETAKELDDSVSARITSSIQDVIISDLPELYQVLTKPEEEIKQDEGEIGDKSTITKTEEDDLPLLSRREHYEGRIGRDMRHLAISIASCVDDVSEWRLFCQQATGGVQPLIECIREGARTIREGGDVSPQRQENYLLSHPGSSAIASKEEYFEIASRACRALRDLCAISLDLSAIITDGLLRANVAFKNKEEPSLMEDMCTLLQYADDSPDVTSQSRKSRLRYKLYVTQLLLAMTCASDSAVDAIRSTEGLQSILLEYSSYAPKQRRRRWLRYPGEMIKSMWLSRRKSKKAQQTIEQRRRPFIEATSLTNDLNGRIQGTANQLLAAIGYNEWVPKIPGQKGLRILCLDGGGSRGMTTVMALKCLVESLGGVEVADCFDMVVGTSTGAIIAFLVGLNRETSEQAVARYDVLIEKIFTKSAFSTPMLLFTTASYDESPFMTVLSDILDDNSMLDSRANPAVPFVFAVTSKMSSTPTHVALFRNYNYNGGELPDPFMIDPDDARENLGLSVESEVEDIRMNNYPIKDESMFPAPGNRKPIDGPRHPGSFRVLQRYALRASTAAPTVFKPVMMGGEMYCDGGIVASNPTAIAIHEARNIFPDVPIELVVSIGTGGFLEQKSEPRIGWDGIIGQIVNSATDGEQIHHILEDILGEGSTAKVGKSSVSNTLYMRFNPTLGLPDEFPIDVTDPEKLRKIKTITREYMQEPEQQRKLQDLADLLQGRSSGFRKWLRR